MEKLIEYQRLDMKIHHLERELENSKFKQDMRSMKAKNDNAIKSREMLDDESVKLMQEYDKNKEWLNKAITRVQKLQETKADELELKEVEDLLKKIDETVKIIKQIERTINYMSNRSKAIIQDFNQATKEVGATSQQYKESKVKQEELVSQKSVELEELKNQRDVIIKLVPKEYLNKYNALKNEIPFPIFVPLVDKRCNGCRMEMSSIFIENLKKSGMLECESCHRIIYCNKDEK